VGERRALREYRRQHVRTCSPPDRGCYGRALTDGCGGCRVGAGGGNEDVLRFTTQRFVFK
jgi:hypothetical protein